MDTRGQQYREKGIEAPSELNNTQEGTENANLNITELRKTKEKLGLIQEDPLLNQSYDGFMFTLTQSFTNAVIVDKHQLVINTSSTKLDLLINAIDLLPLAGSHVSKCGQALKEFRKGTEIYNGASKVCSFAAAQSEFDAVAQDALCDMILEKEIKLKSLNDARLNEHLLPNWASKFKKVVDKITKLGSKVELSEHEIKPDCKSSIIKQRTAEF